MENLDEIKLAADTVIHIKGMPFQLKAGTLVYGMESNLRLAEQGEGMGIDGSNGGGYGCVLTDADAAADLAGTPRPDHPTVSA